MLWADRLLLVSGPSKAVTAALEAGAFSSEQFRAHDLGANPLIEDVAIHQVSRLKVDPRNGHAEVSYVRDDASSHSLTLKSCESQMTPNFVQHAAVNFPASQFDRSEKKSFLTAMSQGSTITFVIAILGSLIFTVLQFRDGGVDLEEDDQGGRRGRGVIRLLALISNTLGGVGMSALTIALIAWMVYSLRSKYQNMLPAIDYRRK